MHLLLLGLFLPFVGGLAALLLGGRRVASAVGAGSAALGGAFGLAAAVPALLGPAQDMVLPLQMPLGAFALRLDALSAVFLIPIFLLGGLCALSGHGAMIREQGTGRLGRHWFFHGLTMASMALAATARDGFLFLLAWEVMSVTPFFLVCYDDSREQTRSAGWIYLAAAHLGGAFLLLFFALIGASAPNLDFGSLAQAAASAPVSVDLLFLLALIGFGAKAGVMPLHVWMPETYPAAPSHVSAFMSGALGKVGIYGLCRVLSWLPGLSLDWGVILVVLGVCSAALGILFAAAQHDLKRLLAYSSVENIGVILAGLGLGLVGRRIDSPMLSLLGFGGALFHVVNHCLFKGLLFLGSGAVREAAGTLAMDRLGGLFKQAPRLGALFLVGSLAIAGLPPLNGFCGELLLYLSASGLGLSPEGTPVGAVMAGWTAAAGLALVGGLASFAFLKAFGSVFLGEPRTPEARHGHEPSRLELAVMTVLAAGCVLAALCSPAIVRSLAPAAGLISGSSAARSAALLAPASGSLTLVALYGFGLALLVAGLALLRARLLAGRSVRSFGTWDCGYLKPTARMEYTGSSFAQNLTELARPLLRAQISLTPPSGLFPERSSFASLPRDLFRRHLFRPLFSGVAELCDRLKIFQQGNVNLYILYIGVTLIVALLWRLG